MVLMDNGKADVTALVKMTDKELILAFFHVAAQMRAWAGNGHKLRPDFSLDNMTSRRDSVKPHPDAHG